jgi:hypothetical protein
MSAREWMGVNTMTLHESHNLKSFPSSRSFNPRHHRLWSPPTSFWVGTRNYSPGANTEVKNTWSSYFHSEGKRPLGRSRRRWEDIRMVLRVIRWEGVDWMHLAQDRDQWQGPVNTVMYIRGGFLTSWITIWFSRRTLLHVVSYISFLHRSMSTWRDV